MNENQTTYPTGAQDEEEIDLVALMVTLLHKLKPILLTAVVCAVIAGGLAGVKILRGGAVSAEDQVAYKEALAEYQQKEKDYEFAVQQYELTAKSNEDAQSSVQEALKQAQDYAEKSLLKIWTFIMSGRRRLTFILTAATKSSRVLRIRMLTRPVRCWLHIRNSWSAVTP